jgi:hypothetical protein
MKPAGGAQSWLNKRLGSLTCDPMAFLRLDAKKQAAALRDLTGVNTTTLDTLRRELYDQRTALGKDSKRMTGALESMAHYPNAPAEAPAPKLSSALELLQEIEAAAVTAQAATDAVAARDRADGDMGMASLATADAEELIDTLTAQLQAAEAALGEAEEAEVAAGVAFMDATKAAATAQAAVIDDTALREQLANLEAVNDAARAEATAIAGMVRSNQDREAKAADIAKVDAERKEKTALIKQADAERAVILAAANMPVKGLSFNTDGVVTYLDRPIDQASRGEQIRVSMGIALAGTEKDGIRIALIRDASLLDDLSLDLINMAAASMRAQVWLERVGDADEGAFIIEDGGMR